MNFETAFAHYQAHTATAEETALVERELEKYRLICRRTRRPLTARRRRR